MNDQTDDVQWTNKLPALLTGLVLIVAGLFASWQRAAIAAVVLLSLGTAFVFYSLTIKDWCQTKGTTLGQSPWGQGFGTSFDSCAREKGWFAF